MTVSKSQKNKIQQVINVFETGSIDGDYANISIYKDGPVINGEKIKQITYGRSQTTEYGNLKTLLQMYIDAKGQYANDFKPYLPKLQKQPSLCTDDVFKKLLKDAARNDVKMRNIQDSFFDTIYYKPALNWANGFKFVHPLSLLVIYDSFIHSGGMLPFLRERFPEMPPSAGGNEKRYIKQYCDVRHEWLSTHSNTILQNTIYRTRCFLKQIENNNWDLTKTINANGTNVI